MGRWRKFQSRGDFSWPRAAEVTREEDAAYSVMGLLGVDISVAYGEGAPRACFRLLRELLKLEENMWLDDIQS